MTIVSFTTANDVARVVGFQSGRRISVAGGMQADVATNDYVRPPDCRGPRAYPPRIQ